MSDAPAPTEQIRALNIAESASSYGLPAMVVTVAAYGGGLLALNGGGAATTALFVLAILALVFAVVTECIAHVLRRRTPTTLWAPTPDGSMGGDDGQAEKTRDDEGDGPLLVRGLARAHLIVAVIAIPSLALSIMAVVDGRATFALVLVSAVAAVLLAAGVAGIIVVRRTPLGREEASEQGAGLEAGSSGESASSSTSTPPTVAGQADRTHDQESSDMTPGTAPETGRITMPDSFRFNGDRPEVTPPKPVQEFDPDTNEETDDDE
jgi:hypothetical protein